jgi:hypothetical protein
MLSLPNDGRYPALDLTPQERRQGTLDALVGQVAPLSRQNTVLMIFEDAHWADPTSLELLGRVVDKIPSLRVLLIMTFRPDFEAPWIGRPYVTALIINPLVEREINAIIDRLIDEGGDGSRRRGRGRANRCRCSVPDTDGPRDFARLADGAFGSARSRQGGGADRCRHRTRVLACPGGRGDAQTGS